MILIIYQEETESRTPARDQIIHVFAFFTFSSSPHEIRYKIPLNISAITAITATYLIASAIRLETNPIGASTFAVSHQGRSPQFISGAAKTDVSETRK